MITMNLYQALECYDKLADAKGVKLPANVSYRLNKAFYFIDQALKPFFVQRNELMNKYIVIAPEGEVAKGHIPEENKAIMNQELNKMMEEMQEKTIEIPVKITLLSELKEYPLALDGIMSFFENDIDI